jgi:hypothetical protein
MRMAVTPGVKIFVGDGRAISMRVSCCGHDMALPSA